MRGHGGEWKGPVGTVARRFVVALLGRGAEAATWRGGVAESLRWPAVFEEVGEDGYPADQYKEKPRHGDSLYQ